MKTSSVATWAFPRQSLILGLVLWAAAVLPGASPRLPPSEADHAALSARARGVLHQIMGTEQSWVKIHAAEALIDAGEAGEIRQTFLRDLAAGEASPIRVGIWRVLANTAPSAAGRAAWIAKIEHVYCDPAAKDRLQAIETLGKLGHRLSGPALEIVRREAAGAPSVEMMLALWSAELAGEPKALEGLTNLLTSRDPNLRGDAAYGLRWLHVTNLAAREALAHAAEVEPAGTYAHPYILGAALTVGADPKRTEEWATALNRDLMSGSTDARFEAAQTLKHRYKITDLPALEALLDDPANDTMVSAASIILCTLPRQ